MRVRDENSRSAKRWPRNRTKYAFDNANELTGISYDKGATHIGDLSYGYDLAGRRTSLGGTSATFTPPAYVPSLIYDGTNRLTSWNGTSLNYDANGNLTGFGATTYTWNARNQLTATSAGGANFSYDALGRRVSATISGTTTPYLFDGLNPAMIGSSFMLAGAGLDEIYASINSTTTTSMLRDGLNSTLALSNASATTTATYAYSPYGDTAVSGTGTTPLQFTGRENDGATGLYYYRARFYSPQLGRFISEDRIGVGAGTNFYAYAFGAPVDLRDPTGRCPWCVAAAIGATIGIAEGAINGYVAGDRGWQLLLDVGVGGVTGAATGAVAGFGLPAIGLRALVSVGGEGWRQAINSGITGCGNVNYAGMALAGSASIFGDSTALIYRGFVRESLSESLHYSVDLMEDVGTHVSDIANELYSLPAALMQGSARIQ
jgi:RHS repeat-associated protein